MPAVDSRKRSGSNVTDGIVDRSNKRRKSDWVSHRELQRLKEVARQGGNLDVALKVSSEDVVYDPWASSPVVEIPQDEASDYLEPPKPKVAPSTLRHSPISLTASGKPIAAVQKPRAGASYNPVFEDWADLLTKEGEREIEVEKRRLEVEEKEAERLARIAQAEADDLGQTDNESAWEGIESEYENDETLNKKRPERKTPAQRNKAKRKRETERQLRHEKKMEQTRIRAEDIRAHAKLLEEKQSVKEQQPPSPNAPSESEDDEKLRRRRLGNVS